MYQLYGINIGDDSVHRINGTSKKTINKQLSCGVSGEAQNQKKVRGYFPVSKRS